LSVDSLRQPIPKGDYMITLTLVSSTWRTERLPHNHEGGTHSQEVGSGYHTHDDGDHDHRIPPDFRGVEPGDRVLVAWCGHQPVVISIVVSS